MKLIQEQLNTPYFITLFKKKTGLTPKQYRRRNRDQPTEEVLHSESKK
ncbi:AraC family transcriptional regulator [Paenibacillus sp. sgz302251]